MRTGLASKNTVKTQGMNRFAELARLGEVVFHTDDLANLWRITNKNTLYTAIKRYINQGLLFRIHKGFYAIKPVAQIDPLLVGLKALHGYGYVSTETILAEQGLIQQQVPAITLVARETRRFAIGAQEYYARKLADKFLYQSTGVVAGENGVRKATRERACADLLYFNRRAYFDAGHLVDWAKVRALQIELGYPVTPERYNQ